MKGISDNGVYLSRMRRTFADKAWFMPSIPEDVKTIVDFGCANGDFLDFLRNDYPEYSYIGIDNNVDFQRECVRRGYQCHRSMAELQEGGCDNDGMLLVLNSVLHEVYSYGCVDSFWGGLMALKPRYVAIRDMLAGNCWMYGSREQRELEAVANESMQGKYADFSRKWGRAYDGYTALHFMLKYFYDENWLREVEEDYLPFTERELHRQIRLAGYDVESEKRYALPYLRKKWRGDFGCDGALRSFIDQATTHVKMFLIREKNDGLA